MMTVEMKEKLKELVANTIEVDEFEEHDRFVEDFGVDSMMVLELVARIEKEFGVSIPDEYFAEFQTFADVALITEKCMKETESASL
ncbi:acyl carrier protein [Laceyella putida]|uniref:Acyl carrier protein n=2 Tax=Laceyella putida TaxID=110101 RepID=A0ABW2RHR5_9BACL